MSAKKRPFDDNSAHTSTTRKSSEAPASPQFELTEHSRRKLKRFPTDCTVQTSDGVEFRLSKSFLSTHSEVFGDMIQALSTESLFTISEDGQTFSFLLDAICAKGNKQPPINMDNVEIIMECARKYNVELQFACDSVIAKHLHMHPFKSSDADYTANYADYMKYHTWADTYELEWTSRICCKFAAMNYMDLREIFGPDWQHRFGILEQKGIMEARVKALHKYHSQSIRDDIEMRFNTRV